MSLTHNMQDIMKSVKTMVEGELLIQSKESHVSENLVNISSLIGDIVSDKREKFFQDKILMKKVIEEIKENKKVKIKVKKKGNRQKTNIIKMEKPSHPKDNKLPVPQQNDQGFMPPSASPNFGSYHSPYVMNYGNDNSINKYSIPSANGGSLHNYFGRSPPTFLMSGGMTPLQSLLNSQHRIESPQFVQGTSPNFGRTHYQDLMADVNDIRNDCRSEGRSSVMSSLSEASIGDLEETKPKESLKNPNPPTILHNSISHKDMTMENVHPAKASQVFEDISIQPNSIDNQAKPVIEKPQIAEELEKEKKVKFEEVKQAEESKEPPAQLPKPRKKRKKLEKKKRSKSWDEEAAKQEQKRRENLEKKKGSLAV